MDPLLPPITGQETAIDPSRPLGALADFYAAFNGRDLVRMQAHWAGGEDIAMSNPLGGIKRGWSEIREVYARIFSGPATVRVDFHDYTLHQEGGLLYAVGRERGEFHRDTTVLALAIRTSRIFRREEGRWRQVHHHGSIEDPALLKAYQEAVRRP